MATINMSSIMQKVRNYPHTDIGKEKTNNVIKQYREKGKNYTEAGDEVITKSKMLELAFELIELLKQTAASYSLPESVIAHFGSLTAKLEDIDDNRFVCYIYFADGDNFGADGKSSLSRPSLENDYREWKGIDNIVALFNNGYSASHPAYGWWNGHAPKGESISRSLTGNEKYAYIRSRQERPSLRFMQTAIEDFYGRYGKKYSLTLTLSDEYI